MKVGTHMYDVVQQTSALDNLILRAQQLRGVIQDFKDKYLTDTFTVETPTVTPIEVQDNVIDNIMNNIQFEQPAVQQNTVAKEMADIDLDSIIAGIDFGVGQTI